MNNLYPRDLETEGFLQAIRNRLRDTQIQMRRTAPRCAASLHCAEHIGEATVRAFVSEPAHLVLLYRIVLEAIVNARKHSQGTRIDVSVRAPEPDSLEIAIRDNGRGGGGPFGEHVGMALMRQRAEEIGATVHYEAGPEGGTIVLVRFARPEVVEHPAGHGSDRAGP